MKFTYVRNPATDTIEDSGEMRQQLTENMLNWNECVQKIRVDQRDKAEMKEKMLRAKTAEISWLQAGLASVKQENEVLLFEYLDLNGYNLFYAWVLYSSLLCLLSLVTLVHC